MGHGNQTVQHFEPEDFPITEGFFSVHLPTDSAGYKPLHEE